MKPDLLGQGVPLACQHRHPHSSLIVSHSSLITPIPFHQDKEYPERVEQIERLKHEIEILKDACAEDIQELDSIAEAEKRNYKHVVDVRMDDIKMKATDVS